MNNRRFKKSPGSVVWLVYAVVATQKMLVYDYIYIDNNHTYYWKCSNEGDGKFMSRKTEQPAAKVEEQSIPKCH